MPSTYTGIPYIRVFRRKPKGHVQFSAARHHPRIEYFFVHYIYRLMVVLTLAAAGCAPVITVNEPFDPARAREYLEEGTNTLVGSSVIPQQGGGVLTCAGRQFDLIPATNLARARMRALHKNENAGFVSVVGTPKLSPPPKEYIELRHNTLCDAQGFFRFERTADDDFFRHHRHHLECDSIPSRRGSIDASRDRKGRPAYRRRSFSINA